MPLMLRVRGLFRHRSAARSWRLRGIVARLVARAAALNSHGSSRMSRVVSTQARAIILVRIGSLL